MASDKPGVGAAGRSAEGVTTFPEEEELTSPGIDPEVQRAMESLKRTQEATTRRVSDITELVKKKKADTPIPVPPR